MYPSVFLSRQWIFCLLYSPRAPRLVAAVSRRDPRRCWISSVCGRRSPAPPPPPSVSGRRSVGVPRLRAVVAALVVVAAAMARALHPTTHTVTHPPTGGGGGGGGAPLPARVFSGAQPVRGANKSGARHPFQSPLTPIAAGGLARMPA